MKDLAFSEILRRNAELESSLGGEAHRVAVLSNITTAQFNDVFGYSLRSQGINANIVSGDYDNIWRDSAKFAGADLVVVFMEAANLVDGLQYKADTLEESARDALVDKVKAEIDLVLSSLQPCPLVLFNRFSSLAFRQTALAPSAFDSIVLELNNHLEHNARTNVSLIDIDQVMAAVSIEKSVDFRYYYSSKALYTIDFYKAYADAIDPVIKSAKGLAKKALIFDCDNTLWKGVLGEDGIDGIEMSADTKAGVVFQEVQHLAVALARRGVLIGLCSKNNPQDVDRVIHDHPAMALREEFIAVKKVNWEDKVANLKAIASELNIGLDSLVMVDDSAFELDFIAAQLGEVTVVKVPSNLHEYPRLMRESSRLFYHMSRTAEDAARGDHYKRDSLRRAEKQSFASVDEFLASLELKIAVRVDQTLLAPRISQLTQKTNQFNLTTRRYTPAEIEAFIASPEYAVLAFEARDKFGDYGLTGVGIVRIDAQHRLVVVDSLLMSCRVIGRNLELKFLDAIVDYAKRRGMTAMQGEYIETPRNEQVADFYKKAGFARLADTPPSRTFRLRLDDYQSHSVDYIEDVTLQG